MDRTPTTSPATAPRLLAFLAALALLALLPRPAHAEIGACIVLDTLPANIDVPGRYCLDHDIIGTYNVGHAVEIRSDNVVFDCNGFRLVDTNPANTNTGIAVTGDREATTIRNCVIDGFQLGILVQEVNDNGSRSHVIENNTVLNPRQGGIWVGGSDIRIEGNRVLGGVYYGIRLYSANKLGVGNTIRDNVIADFKPVDTATTIIGITFFNVHDTEVTGNTISGLHALTNQGVYGINSSSAPGALVANNHILSSPALPAPLDGANYAAISLQGTVEELSTNLCHDNTVGHFNINIQGCASVGNTEF